MFVKLFGNRPKFVKSKSMRILYSSVFQKNALRKIALVFFTMVALTAPASLVAQSKTVDKANELYKNSQFADAAVLYRQALTDMESNGKQSRNATLLKSKLAFCYRMNNKMDKAEELYAEVVKDETAKPDTYYYYGEALMSNGKYAEAKKWFTDYQKLEPTDEKTVLMLRACEYAPLIEPYFQYVDIQDFPYNSDADDNAPIATSKGLLFSSDRPQGGIKILKEKSGWTGRDYLNLYISEKKPDGSFAEPTQYSSKLSEVNKHTGNASLTADASEIFFTRNDNVLNKQNTYSLQIYSAKSGNTERWKDVEKLPFCSSNQIFMHPAVSPDGKLLYFASNRAGGFGGTDLWVSERKDGEWGKPENLGPAVNTTANEGFPFVALDGKLFFCSKGHPGFGSFDIFVTYKDENGAWQPATNLGKPINSPLDDISIFVSNDQKNGYFTSSRSGGDDDIYIFKVLDGPSTQPSDEPVPTIVETSKIIPAPVAPAPVKEEVMATASPKDKTLPEPEVTVTAPVVEEIKKPVLEKPATERLEVKTPEPAKVETAPALETIVATKIPEPPVEPILPKEEGNKASAVEMIKSYPLEEKINQPTKVETTAAIQPVIPIVQHQSPALTNVDDLAQLASFDEITKKLNGGSLEIGERFRLDGAVYDPVVWQLTPRITGPLDDLVSLLKQYPSLQIEISSHTEALGVDEDNLHISQNRASTVLDYLLREGISKQRIIAKGCGETMLLNQCKNGVICTMKEHLVNQRLEVKVIGLDGRS